MSSLKKLQRDFRRADLSAVEALIGQLSDDDVMARFGLEDRRDEIRSALASQAIEPEQLFASAALFFGGRPVVGSRGIESEFGTAAVSKFQDLVSKVLAHQSGGLGSTGPVPNKGASALHITNIVRGSFGFQLEELSTQGQIVESSLKAAVDDAANLLKAFGEPDEESFRTVVESVDDRILGTARDFFDLLRQRAATMRVVSGDIDRSFDNEAVSRAAERAYSTNLEERETEISGLFSGALPHSRQFEMLDNDRADAIRGRVDRAISSAALADFNKNLVGNHVVAKVRKKTVFRNGQVARESFTLLTLTDLGPVEPVSE